MTDMHEEPQQPLTPQTSHEASATPAKAVEVIAALHARIHNREAADLDANDQLAVGEMLNQLISLRQLNTPQYLAPQAPLDVQPDGAKFPPFYSDYCDGTFNVSWEHMQHIFPGLQPSSAELNDRLRRRDENNEAYGTMPWMETALSVEIARALRPRTAFVIGTHLGHHIGEMMHAMPEDTAVVTLDLKPSAQAEATYPLDGTNRSFVKHTDEEIGAVLQDPSFPHGNRVVQLFGDSAQFDYEPYRGKMDLVVVDGNHMLPNVLSDLRAASQMVSPNGVILIDDYSKPFRLEGVATALGLFTARTGRTFYYANHFQLKFETAEFTDSPPKTEPHLTFHVNAPQAIDSRLRQDGVIRDFLDTPDSDFGL